MGVARHTQSNYYCTLSTDQRVAVRAAIDRIAGASGREGAVSGITVYMYPTTGVPRHIEVRLYGPDHMLLTTEVVWHNGRMITHDKS